MDPLASPLWSDLHNHILLKIADCLHSRDRFSFRAVCRSWRSVLPPPDRTCVPPLLLPFPMGPNHYIHPRRTGYFKLVESTVYFLQSLKKTSNPWKTPKAWLIRIEDSQTVGKVRLLDPLLGIGFHNLSPHLPRVLNPFDFKISEVAKLYSLRFVDNNALLKLNVNEIKSTYASKVAVCCEGSDFAIMAVHTAGQLSFWKSGDKEWMRIGRDEVYYEDVVYRKGKFYAVESSGFTIMIDLQLNIRQAASAIISVSGGDGRKHLVHCLFKDDLFLLDRNLTFGDDDDENSSNVSTDFKVYKLNEKMQRWVEVKSLEHRAIFVGNVECSFSVSAKEFPGCKKNCIYFDHDHTRSLKCDLPGSNAALFDLERSSASMLSQVYGYSVLFWPPPPWILAHSSGR